jgi:peptidoglycan biosynthesis protein MviN/MurJ (putative lipid II flippase)
VTTADMAGAGGGGFELATPEGAVGDSMSVAVWTAISRLTGVFRGITIAAVLGATYFANTYQFTNSLPNLVFYGLLAGSMFSSLLVPALVHHIDAGDERAAARTAGGLLGVAALGMLLLIPLVAIGTPWLLRLGSLGATNAAAAQSQVHEGAILVLLFLPQVPLYAVVGTATAVMNAHRRFALAAAAPALENIGTIAILGVVAVLYSRSATQQHTVPFSLMILLGAGTTCAVLLHASIQWWGARRVGVTLVPNAGGWRDPEVRATTRRAVPAAVQAALASLQVVALLLVADRVAGGVVAFQLGLNFQSLPIAIGATPVALSLVPRLARMTEPGQAGMFRDTYVRGVSFAGFLVIPAATAYAVIALPLAGAIGFGAFAKGGGRILLAAVLSGLALAVVGETLFAVSSYACYARKDTTHPLRGMIIQTLVCAAGIAVAVQLHGTAFLTGLGLAYSLGTVAAASYLAYHLRRRLPHGGEPALRPLLRTLACSAIMAVPVWASAYFVADRAKSAAQHVALMLVICVVGAGIYFAAQAAMGAPQIQWVTGALLSKFRRRPGPSPVRADHTAADHAGRPLLRTLPLALTAGVMYRIGPALRRRQLDAVMLLAPLVVGILIVVKVKYAIGLTVVILLIGWVMLRPAIAAYLLVFLTPLVVGLNAGSVVPGLRANEGLMVVVGIGVGLRWLVKVRSGEVRWPQINAVDVTLVALCVFSSVVPLAMMVVRQRPITSDDFLYAIVLWKLFAEYVIVRLAITTREQALRCLVLLMIASAIVALVAIAQVGLPPVAGLLNKYISTGGTAASESGNRGSSLLGLPDAAADLEILSLGIAIAMISRGYPHRLWLAALAVLYVLGVFAAAEFATVIGLVVAVLALLVLTRYVRLAAYAAPVAVLGGLLLWPVLSTRLAGFQSASGLPQSWEIRLINLRTYFWPTLFSDGNWILGVRPSARILNPGRTGGYVWIESGYTWLLWGGGIPLLASYVAFAGSVLRRSWAFARRADPAGVAATAVAAAMCAQVVLMLLDPHLTYRGSADELFMMLALIRALPARRARATAHREQPAAAAVAVPQLRGVPA